MEELSTVKMLQKFFGNLTLKEIKEVPADDRRELAELAAEEMKIKLVPYDPSKPKT